MFSNFFNYYNWRKKIKNYYMLDRVLNTGRSDGEWCIGTVAESVSSSMNKWIGQCQPAKHSHTHTLGCLHIRFILLQTRDLCPISNSRSLARHNAASLYKTLTPYRRDVQTSLAYLNAMGTPLGPQTEPNTKTKIIIKKEVKIEEFDASS